MKFHKKLSLLICCLFCIQVLHAQMSSLATKKGSQILSFDLSFKSNGGELYEEDDDIFFYYNQPDLYSKFDLNYWGFAGNKFALGWAWEVDVKRVQGQNFVSIVFGPQMAYFFDNGSNFIPYVNVRGSYIYDFSYIDWDDKTVGYRATLNGGVLIRRNHLAFTFESGLDFDRIKIYGDKYRGYTINMSIGVAYIIYKDDK